MRITTGKYKGRNLIAPDGLDIRPTSDRARQAVFNILLHGAPAQAMERPLPQGCVVLDVFCGTGAIGLEALSRGAELALFIDQNVQMARQNSAAMKAMGDCEFIAARLPDLPQAKHKADLAFLDPPYHSGLIEPSVLALRDKNYLAASCILVLESAKDEIFSLPPDFAPLEQRIYGAAKVGFYKFG